MCCFCVIGGGQLTSCIVMFSSGHARDCKISIRALRSDKTFAMKVEMRF